MMKVRRQRISDSRSLHREARTARTSETGARYSQAHDGAGRAKCPAWRVHSDHEPHVGRCMIGVQGLIEKAHQFVTHSLVDRQPVQCLQHWSAMVMPAQTHHQASAIVRGQPQSPQCTGRLIHQQRVTVVHPGHHQGQHGLGAGVTCPGSV